MASSGMPCETDVPTAWQPSLVRNLLFLRACQPHTATTTTTEGRVENGALHCSYHGYAFDSAGACISVPHASDADAHARALASPRSCVEAYPTMQARGMLWVWAHPNSAAQAAAQPPLLDVFEGEENGRVDGVAIAEALEPLVRTLPCTVI